MDQAKGWGNRSVEVQILIGKTWNLTIQSKGASTLDLPVQQTHWLLKRFRCSNSSYVQVPWFSVWGQGMGVGSRDFGSGCNWRPMFSPLHMLQLSDLWFWSVVSGQLSTSSNSIGPGFVVATSMKPNNAKHNKTRDACSLEFVHKNSSHTVKIPNLIMKRKSKYMFF